MRRTAAALSLALLLGGTDSDLYSDKKEPLNHSSKSSLVLDSDSLSAESRGQNSTKRLDLEWVDERFHVSESGELERIAENSGIAPPPPRLLQNTGPNHMLWYESLQKRGEFPNLSHLDGLLLKTAEEMALNADYFQNRQWVSMISPHGKGQLFSAYGNITLPQGNYKVFINASGKMVDGKFHADRLIEYSATNEHIARDKTDVERRQFGALIERWWVPGIYEGKKVSRRARISYPLGSNEDFLPDFTGIRQKIIYGLNSQAIRR